jgi:hypothetical protein
MPLRSRAIMDAAMQAMLMVAASVRRRLAVICATLDRAPGEMLAD